MTDLEKQIAAVLESIPFNSSDWMGYAVAKLRTIIEASEKAAFREAHHRVNDCATDLLDAKCCVGELLQSKSGGALARVIEAETKVLREALDHLVWAAEVQITTTNHGKVFRAQHKAKVSYWIEQARAALANSEKPS